MVHFPFGEGMTKANKGIHPQLCCRMRSHATNVASMVILGLQGCCGGLTAVQVLSKAHAQLPHLRKAA